MFFDALDPDNDRLPSTLAKYLLSPAIRALKKTGSNIPKVELKRSDLFGGKKARWHRVMKAHCVTCVEWGEDL